MVRKSTYSKADIVRAALGIIEAKGVHAFTARRIADALGSSTAPVYSNFESMEDLLDEVMAGIGRQILEYCRRPWTEDVFLNMGVGFVAFAMDHAQLFRAMYLDTTLDGRHDDALERALRADLAADPCLSALPAAVQDEVLFQASIYTHGIATTVATGHWPDPDLATVERWLRGLGGLLIRAAMESEGLPVPAELQHDMSDFMVPWRHRGKTGSEEGDDD